MLAKLPEGRVKEKLAAAQLLNVTDNEVIVSGPASLVAVAPAAGKQLSEALGRPVKLTRKAA